MPSSIAADLPEVAIFALEDVPLAGTLPLSLSNMSLQIFLLDNTQLSGAVPPMLGSLNTVTYFQISDMPLLTGTVPRSLGSLSTAMTVVLGNLPSLTGTIPKSLSSLESVLEFWLDTLPGLSGTLPEYLFRLPSVTGVIVQAMDGLTGSLPDFASLPASVTLADIYLSRLPLYEGTIPSSVASLPALETLDLMSLPAVSGTIPPSLGSVDNLGFFRLSGSALVSGTIPSSIGSLRIMEIFVMSYLPQLSGSLPASLNSLQAVTQINIDALEGMSGTMPKSWVPGPHVDGATLNTKLREFTAASSGLTGSIKAVCIDEKVATRTALRFLHLANNDLTSLDLSAWNPDAKCPVPVQLQWLDMHGNPNLRGTLPSSLAQLSELEDLAFFNCDLSGTLPLFVNDAPDSHSWTGAGSRVRYVDLGKNRFSGALPPSLGSLSELTFLDLTDNMLEAVLPASFCSLNLANVTHCNISGQRPWNDSSVVEWDCSALLRDCAQQVADQCGAGARCVSTSHLVKPLTLYLLIAGGAAVLVIAVIVTVVLVRRERFRRARLRSQSQRRAATIGLLQSLLPEDEDVEDVMLPPGSVDFGPRSELVASGGGGSVYRSTLTLATTQRKLAAITETVALKEIHAMQDLVAIREGVEEFAKELVVLIRLSHPHIISFYGVYQFFDPVLARGSGGPGDRYFLVTQFADHGSLEDHIEADFVNGPSLPRRLSWWLQITKAVEYLHRENFVHRDLKPGNVLMHGNEWRCLLTDFGIARSLASGRTLTSQIGTAQFMPPEALSGLAQTPQGVDVPAPATVELAKAWDTYSLACLAACLFNCCALPYPDLDERVVMVRVLIDDLRPEMPAPLGELLQKLLVRMWAKDPANRPDSCSVRQALEEAEMDHTALLIDKA